MASLGSKIVKSLGLLEPVVEPKALSPGLREGRARKFGYKTEAFRGINRPYDGAKVEEPQWFAKDPQTAETYLAKVDDSWNVSSSARPSMTKAKLRLGKSLQVDAQGEPWMYLKVDGIKDPKVREEISKSYPGQEIGTDTVAAVAQRLGYDSVTFKNIKDEMVTSPTRTKPTTVYAVFKPKNIRGHLANFEDPESDSLMAGLLGTVGTGAIAAGALGGRKDEV
jgi:hypothetical protein